MNRRACALILSLAAVVGCSDDPSSSTSSPAPSASDGAAGSVAPDNSSAFPPELTPDGKVLFAETINSFVMNTVVAFGDQGMDTEAIADAVTIVYPSLSVEGYAIEADGSNLSIMSTLLDDKGGTGADNPYVVAVATRQVSGECFGSAIHGFPLPTTRVDFTTLSSCTAQAVLDALAAQLG